MLLGHWFSQRNELSWGETNRTGAEELSLVALRRCWEFDAGGFSERGSEIDAAGFSQGSEKLMLLWWHWFSQRKRKLMQLAEIDAAGFS